MSLQTDNFSSIDLDCFRQYQRRSFDTLIEVGRTLKADTEWLDEDLLHTRFRNGEPMPGVAVGEASSAGYDQASDKTKKIVSSGAALSYNELSPTKGPI